MIDLPDWNEYQRLSKKLDKLENLLYSCLNMLSGGEKYFVLEANHYGDRVVFLFSTIEKRQEFYDSCLTKKKHFYSKSPLGNFFHSEVSFIEIPRMHPDYQNLYVDPKPYRK